MASFWNPAPKRLAFGFTALAAITYGLITLGALVRAHGAGLACPDWPLCFGEFIPTFDVKVAFEWGHRVLAGSVSIGLLALSLQSLRSAELRSLMRPRLMIAWGLLFAQVVFGGLTVLHRLAPWTVSGHLVLGNSFCLTLAWIAGDLFDRAQGRRRTRALPASARRLVVGVAFFLGLQLILGGLVAGSYAGLACSSFPTCNGTEFIPSLRGGVGLHVLHRLNGFVLLLGFLTLTAFTRGMGRIGLYARMGLGLVLLQILLGVTDVLLRLPVEITALHTATAAAIVLTTTFAMREVVLTRGAKTPAHVDSAVGMVKA